MQGSILPVPNYFLAESLLQGALPNSASCSRRALGFLFLTIGLGSAILWSQMSSTYRAGGRHPTVQELIVRSAVGNLARSRVWGPQLSPAKQSAQTARAWQRPQLTQSVRSVWAWPSLQPVWARLQPVWASEDSEPAPDEDDFKKFKD